MVGMTEVQIGFIKHPCTRTGGRGAVKMRFTVDMARCDKSGPVSDITGLFFFCSVEGRMDSQIPCHYIPSGHVREEISFHLSFREVLEILNVMESFIFSGCSVLRLIFMKGCWIDLKKEKTPMWTLQWESGMWSAMTIRCSVDYLCILTSERQWLMPVCILYMDVI